MEEWEEWVERVEREEREERVEWEELVEPVEREVESPRDVDAWLAFGRRGKGTAGCVSDCHNVLVALSCISDNTFCNDLDLLGLDS